MFFQYPRMRKGEKTYMQIIRILKEKQSITFENINIKKAQRNAVKMMRLGFFKKKSVEKKFVLMIQ